MTLCLLRGCVLSDARSRGLGEVDVCDPGVCQLVYMCSLEGWL